MSRHDDSFQLAVPPEETKNLCGQAIVSLGWPIVDLGYGWSTSESFGFGFTWPVTMQVIINYGDEGKSSITINASNFGFGPIQSSHVRGKVATLRQRIEQMFQQGPQPAAQPQQRSTSSQPSKAEEIFRDGVLLDNKQK